MTTLEQVRPLAGVIKTAATTVATATVVVFAAAEEELLKPTIILRRMYFPKPEIFMLFECLF